MAVSLKSLPAGTYIVAVSGGVDSMVLLNLLCSMPGLRLIVAHVNHGIRSDSGVDEEIVVSFCKSHNIEYEVKKLYLGPKTSEESARKARYSFLRQYRTMHNAKYIITAHHQDDLIETALINLLRGTGWRGIAPFVDSPDILRPLIKIPKQELIAYATTQKLAWHEDQTNTDERYLRNYVRHRLMPIMTKRDNEWRDYLLRTIRNQQDKRRTIDKESQKLLNTFSQRLGNHVILTRYDWIMLPHTEAYELFQALCRAHIGNSLVRELAESALLFIKTARPERLMPLGGDWRLRTTRSQIIVEPRQGVVS